VWALGTKEASTCERPRSLEGIKRVAEGYKVRGLYP